MKVVAFNFFVILIFLNACVCCTDLSNVFLILHLFVIRSPYRKFHSVKRKKTLPKNKERNFHRFSVTACIRRQEGFCCIQYQVCPNVPNAFALEVITSFEASVDTKCTSDYIVIPGIKIHTY